MIYLLMGAIWIITFVLGYSLGISNTLKEMDRQLKKRGLE